MLNSCFDLRVTCVSSGYDLVCILTFFKGRVAEKMTPLRISFFQFFWEFISVTYLFVKRKSRKNAKCFSKITFTGIFKNPVWIARKWRRAQFKGSVSVIWIAFCAKISITVIKILFKNNKNETNIDFLLLQKNIKHKYIKRKTKTSKENG